MPSESFTTSLHSVNSPVFIKKYDKRANCLLSRSYHHYLVGAIIGPCPIRTRECVRICVSVSTHTCASRAPFAPAHERPGHASHLLATHTRLWSYLWVLHMLFFWWLNTDWSWWTCWRDGCCKGLSSIKRNNCSVPNGMVPISDEYYIMLCYTYMYIIFLGTKVQA